MMEEINGRDEASEMPELAKEAPQDDAVISIEVKKYEEMLAEIKDAKHEAQVNYEKYLRSLADLENSRKRAEKDRTDTLKYGLESVFKDLLPVLDSFNRALASIRKDEASADDWQAFHQGMELVEKQLLETLGQRGLQAVVAKGAAFDPNLHQAIQKIPRDDVSTEVVHEEFSRGYTLNGRLIRPAMVSVAIPSDDA